MKVEVITREEALKRFGRRGTTISTVSPEEFARRSRERWAKRMAEEAKAKAEAEAKAQATSPHTEE